MSRLLRAASFFGRDRAGRVLLLVAGGTGLLLPRALPVAEPGPGAAGFRAGLEAGPSPGSLAGLWGVLLLAGVLLLWQGIVSSDVESGRFRTALARPLWRPGFFLARHGAALALLVLASAVVWVPVRAGGGGAASGVAGVALAALLTGWTLGALLLLLSSVLDRGDVLAAVALVLAPDALDGTVPPAGPLAAAAEVVLTALPPTAALRELRHALVAGGAPDGGQVLAVLAYGGAALALALLRLRAREYRGS